MAEKLNNVESQNSQDATNQQSLTPSDRRSFLKLGATLGASLIAAPGFSYTKAETNTSPIAGPDKITKHRT